MDNEHLTTAQWQAIAEKLAENLEVQCSLLPYYDGKEAEDFIEEAKKELGYE